MTYRKKIGLLGNEIFKICQEVIVIMLLAGFLYFTTNAIITMWDRL